MGILNLPEKAIPVYHQGSSEEKAAAHHVAASAFPIGGRGNVSVLLIHDPALLKDIPPEAWIILECAGQRLAYRAVSGTPTDGNAEMLLLVSADGRFQITCIRSEMIK